MAKRKPKPKPGRITASSTKAEMDRELKKVSEKIQRARTCAAMATVQLAALRAKLDLLDKK